MKLQLSIAVFILLSSCSEKTSDVSKEPVDTKESAVVENGFGLKPEFAKVLEDADLNGSILIKDGQTGALFTNDSVWAVTGHLPASTFKIVNSMIALETGIVENENSVFEWDGTPRRMKIWEENLTLKEAFHRSCVPCYQEVARDIGVERMQEHLDKFQYGTMEVLDSTLDLFWLQGASKISQLEQIEFLERFYTRQLPIESRTDSILRNMIVIDANEEYTLSGKTGWSIREGNNNGWFVGYVETKGNVYYVAVNVDPTESFDMNLFGKIRIKVALKAFKEMGIIL